jgi:hypothetical protein
LILASCETLPTEGDPYQAAVETLAKRYHIQREDRSTGEVVTEWLPQYNEWDDVHYRLRATARVSADRLDLKVEREDRDPYSGQWDPKGTDPEEEEQLRHEIKRRLRH